MHLALALERHHAGLRVAPRAERLGPLPDPVPVEPADAQLDHGAVRQSGDLRRAGPGADVRHHLVERGDGRHRVAEHRHATPVTQSRQHVGIDVAGRPRPLRCLREELPPARGVAGEHQLRGLGLQEQRGKPAVGVDLGAEGAKDACPKPRCAGDVAAIDQVEAEPEGAARGLDRPALRHESLVGPLPHTDHLVVAADHVGGDGEPLQVFRRQRTAPVCGGQPVVLDDPVLGGRGLRRWARHEVFQASSLRASRVPRTPGGRQVSWPIIRTA